MGMGMLGFLGGASGQALDAIKSRQDDERDMRKTKMLEELRRDTAVFLADYQEKLNSKKVDDKLSGYDSASKQFVMRNGNGDEIGRREDKGMQEDYEFDRKKQGLSLDALSAQVDQSKSAAEENRAQAARARQGASLDRQTASAASGNNERMSDGEAASELLYQAKDAAAQARSAGVPQAKIEEMAELAVKNAKNADDARRYFTQSLGFYTTPTANAARTKQKQMALDEFKVKTGR